MAARRDSQPSSRDEPSAPERPDLEPAPQLATLALSDANPGDLLEGVVLSTAGMPVELAGSRLLSSRLEFVGMSEIGMRGARLSDVVIATPNCTVLRAPYGQWRDVVVDGGRIGTIELYETELARVALCGVRVRYLNLRSARVSDLTIEDCVIDELDLGGAELLRVAFPGTRVGRLEVGFATLEAVDLRGARIETLVGARDLAGAVVDATQVVELAPVLAAALGLRVV